MNEFTLRTLDNLRKERPELEVIFVTRNDVADLEGDASWYLSEVGDVKIGYYYQDKDGFWAKDYCCPGEIIEGVFGQELWNAIDGSMINIIISKMPWKEAIMVEMIPEGCED